MSATATTRSPLTWPSRDDGLMKCHRMTPDQTRTLCGLRTGGNWITADLGDVLFEEHCSRCEAALENSYYAAPWGPEDDEDPGRDVEIVGRVDIHSRDLVEAGTWLTSAMTAQRLGLTPDRVRQLYATGRISATLFGRQLLYTEADVTTFQPAA